MSETAGTTEPSGPAPAESSGTNPGARSGPSTSPEAYRHTGGVPVAGPAELSGKVSGRNTRKVREGYVRSDRMQKTIVVALEDRKQHPLYGKIMRFTERVKAHDEHDSAGVGDRVLLMETRPLAATKRWRLVQILERAK